MGDFFDAYMALESFGEVKGVPIASLFFIVANNRCIFVLRRKRAKITSGMKVLESLEDG